MAVDNDTAWLVEDDIGAVRWLTLSRPEQRNALSSGMIAALQQGLDAATANPAIRCIVLAGSGSVFSAGHDLREMTAQADETDAAAKQRVRDILKACSAMMLSINACPKAVIACVPGIATAAGCQLVAACDLAVASTEARFCLPGVNIGAFCTTPLVAVGRAVHRKHAMEMALTGDMFSADEAMRMGLVNRTVPADTLHSVTGQLAAGIAGKSAEGIRRGKQAFYQQIDMPLEQAYAFTCEPMIETMTTEDAHEGVAAFFGKRTPVWPGSQG